MSNGARASIRHVRDRPAAWRTVETASLTHERAARALSAKPRSRNVSARRRARHVARGAHRRADRSAGDRLQGARNRSSTKRPPSSSTRCCESPADVIAVSEQIGWDVVPVAAAARLFSDAMGRMAQRLAQRAGRLYLVVAGYALDLRALGVSIEDAADL